MSHTNLSIADRVVRMSVGFTLLILAASGLVGVSGLAGLVLIVTAYAGHCPLYYGIEFSTVPQKQIRS